MNTIDITPIVNAVIALIGAGVSVFLIPWLKSQTTEAYRMTERGGLRPALFLFTAKEVKL